MRLSGINGHHTSYCTTITNCIVMKSRLIVSALLFSFLFVYSPSLRAQKIVYWEGGTPGMESNWNCPDNWSTNAVPNAFSDVIIPDVSTRSRVYPILSHKDAEVNKLTLESGAALLVQNGSCLVVFDSMERFGLNDLDVRGSVILKGNLAVAGSIIGSGFDYVLGKK